MENKKITPPDGYKFEVISETEIKLVPVETKAKYPTKIEEIEKHYYIDRVNCFKPVFSVYINEHHSSEATALKFAAMMQLIEFRDAWNKIDGFVADFNNVEQGKWSIAFSGGDFSIVCLHYDRKALHFGSRETAELFLNTHRALIEQAGDLV